MTPRLALTACQIEHLLTTHSIAPAAKLLAGELARLGESLRALKAKAAKEQAP